MQITFLLPDSGVVPVGGVKIVYEYANRLAQREHRVCVIHAADCRRGDSLSARLRLWGRYYWQWKWKAQFGVQQWFSVDPGVTVRAAPTLAPRNVGDGDIVVATAWQTAEWVATYPPSKGQKFYLIQHKETWGGPEERVLRTWSLPLRKIVISRWLEQIARDLGQSAAYVPNGLDFRAFGIDVAVENRAAPTVMMLHHKLAWKGAREGLQALYRVKERFPELHATLFGVPRKPDDLPAWISYFQQPDQRHLRRLYNEHAIFLAPSRSEGWGLPGCEAMMCGAAVVATDIGGHREFAVDGQTALLVPPGDSAAMADKICCLIANPKLRRNLAVAGEQFVRRFTWERATPTVESLFARALAGEAAVRWP